MSNWPVSLPQNQFIGMTEQRQEARLFSKVDAGPPKVRRRFTAVSRYVTVMLILTGDEKITFDAFYETDLLEGILPFDWEDPVSDLTASFHARKGTPSFRLVEGGLSGSTRRWEGSWELEIRP